jgi:hypothetical protein
MSIEKNGTVTDFATGRRRTTTSRAEELAQRLERGAASLAELGATLTEAEWNTRLPGDGRKIGVVIHHVASVYPIEIQLAQIIASGQTMTGVTMNDVHKMNAAHAAEHDGVGKTETIELLRRNSAAAAAAIRALSDDELDMVAPASLYGDAPVTCQFVLEDHAVRHSYHHLSRIKFALQLAA